jgi:hypothetical protein
METETVLGLKYKQSNFNRSGDCIKYYCNTATMHDSDYRVLLLLTISRSTPSPTNTAVHRIRILETLFFSYGASKR